MARAHTISPLRLCSSLLFRRAKYISPSAPYLTILKRSQARERWRRLPPIAWTFQLCWKAGLSPFYFGKNSLCLLLFLCRFLAPAAPLRIWRWIRTAKFLSRELQARPLGGYHPIHQAPES